MPEVAIVGAGLIGCSWSVVFARSGWNVRLMDVDENRLRAAQQSLNGLHTGHPGRENNQNAKWGSIFYTASLPEAVRDVGLVQECGPELVETKRDLFAQLTEFASADAILASSSSAIAASRFTSELTHRERCLVAHPLNPPHLAPLVELCGAPWTAPSVVAEALALYESVGQVPIVLKREVEGFVLNRLQAILLSEALRLVGEGVVSASDLDKTVSEGLGLRWSFMGPFATIELNAPGGIGTYLSRYGPAFRSIAADPPPPEVWDVPNIRKVLSSWGAPPTPEQLTARGAWRDRRLQALRDHKAAQDMLDEG